MCSSVHNSLYSQPRVNPFSNVSVNAERKEQPEMAAGLGKDGRAGVPAAVRGLKARGTKRAWKWKMKSNISRELKEAKAGTHVEGK